MRLRVKRAGACPGSDGELRAHTPAPEHGPNDQLPLEYHPAAPDCSHSNNVAPSAEGRLSWVMESEAEGVPTGAGLSCTREGRSYSLLRTGPV